MNTFNKSGRQVAFPWQRLILLLFAGFAALAGLAGAFARSNIPFIATRFPLADAHGALMTFGFLGTAVCLERGVAFRAGSPHKPRWGFLAPVFGAFGTVAMILLMARIIPVTSVWQAIPGSLWALSMLMLSAVYVMIWRRQHSVSVLIQLLGSVAGMCGMSLWVRGLDAAALAPCWMVFLVLTIVGERLELAHVSFVGLYVEPTLIGSSVMTILALPVQLMVPAVGFPLLGIGMAVLLITMLMNDTAIKTWKYKGVTGFMGVCMLLGYVWALLASLVWIVGVYRLGGYWSDFSIHAFALGFAVSMVIAHVCVIVPSILRRQMPYSPVLWLPLILLHLGLLLRLLGTIQALTLLWQVGDGFTIGALFLLLVCVLGMNLAVTHRRKIRARQECARQERNVDQHWQKKDSKQEREDSSQTQEEALLLREKIERAAAKKAQNKPLSRDRARQRITMTRSDILAYVDSHKTFFSVTSKLVWAVIVVLFVCTAFVAIKPAVVAQQAALTSNTSSLGTSSSSSPASSSFSSSNSSSSTVKPTGKTTKIALSVGTDGMSFSPSIITVPAGNKLILIFSNTAEQSHDLVLETGATSGKVSPGSRARILVGVVTHNLTGWCSLTGHRQMGMTLTIKAIAPSGQEISGSSDSTPSSSSSSSSSSSHAAISHQDVSTPSYADLQKQAKKSAVYNPKMPGYTPGISPSSTSSTSSTGTVRTLTMTVTEQKVTIADGVTQKMMQYNASNPGPILRGKEGDTFRITLINKGSMTHSIDFHAGDDAAPNKAMKSIEPGHKLTYVFHASHAGIWLYHCSTMPMSNHIANGMYGAVIIEPKAGFPSVSKEYVLIASEAYLGPNGGMADPAKIIAMQPDITMFNGRAFQYDAHPLTAQVGEKVRIWVMNAGPNLPLSFHIVGTQLTTVWTEGNYRFKDNSRAGAQVLPLLAAQGGFVEMTFKTPGRYPIVNHSLSLAEKGQHGYIWVK